MEKESRIIKAAQAKVKEKCFNPQHFKGQGKDSFKASGRGRKKGFSKGKVEGKVQLSADAKDGASATPAADSTTWQGQSEEPYQQY